jgi:hypothetical protein
LRFLVITGILFCLFLPAQAFQLYINKGYYQFSDADSFPVRFFNNTPQFRPENFQIRLKPGDSLKLWLINNDGFDHLISISNTPNSQKLIVAGDSALYELWFEQEAVYILQDTSNNSEYSYSGLATPIIVSAGSHTLFTWNIKEFDKGFCQRIDQGNWDDSEEYEPKYFVVNERSNPAIDSDTNARITGSVGDTLFLVIANTGNSIHSIHFHGFHAMLSYSSLDTLRLGWIKDTYGILPNECVILMIVPDKPGIYPVHDHNLVAVTGGGIYPNGMFSTIYITE